MSFLVSLYVLIQFWSTFTLTLKRTCKISTLIVNDSWMIPSSRVSQNNICFNMLVKLHIFVVSSLSLLFRLPWVLNFFSNSIVRWILYDSGTWFRLHDFYTFVTLPTDLFLYLYGLLSYSLRVFPYVVVLFQFSICNRTWKPFVTLIKVQFHFPRTTFVTLSLNLST